MKNFFLLFFSICITANLYSQYCGGSGPSVCTPGGPYSQLGLFPRYDSLPCAQIGVPYFQHIDMQIPAQVYYLGAYRNLNYVKINSISNLPCGLCWKSDVANNQFNGNTTHCIIVQGTTYDAPGQYKLAINIDAQASIGGFPVTLTNQDAEQFGIKYWGRVQNLDGTCVLVDTLISGLTAHTSGTPATPTITGTPSFCTGGSTTLTLGNAASFYAYKWSNNTYGSFINVSSAGIYSVTAYGACSSASASVNVTLNQPAPTISANGNTTFCQGGSVGLSVTNTFSSYAWSTGATTQSITATAGGNYTCTVTQGGCSGTSNTISVTVNSNPTSTITNNGPLTFCQGGSVTLDAGAGFASYAWSNAATTQTINATTGGAYSVTITQNNCSASSSASVTVNSNPTPTVTANGSTNICAGNSVTLDAGAGYASYLWSNNATTQTIGANSTGNYTCTVTQNGCSGTSNTVSVTVTDPTPTVTASGPLTFCTGGNVTLDAGTGYTSYAWSNSASTQSINVSSAGIYTVTVVKNGCTGVSEPDTVVVTSSGLTPTITALPSANICPGGTATLDVGSGYSSYAWNNAATTQSISTTNAGTYSVTVTQGACSGSTSITVTAGNIPPAVMIMPMGTVTICQGQTAVFNAGAGFDSYLWNNSITTQNDTAQTAGTYIVTVTKDFCVGIDSVQLAVNSNPSPAITGNFSICTGGTSTLDAGNGYSSYLWSTAETTQTISTNTGGSYSVTVAQNGCSGSASATVTLNSNPSPSITASGALTQCEGDSISLDAGSGFSSYAWSTGATTQSIYVKVAGSYTCTVTQNGCSGASNTLTFATIARPTPTITSSGSTTLCDGDTVTLDAGAGYAGYNWSTGANTQTIDVTTSDVYSVSVLQNGCNGAASPVAVNVNPVPTASINILGSIGFTAYLQASPSGATYEWLYQQQQTGPYTSLTVTTQNDTVSCGDIAEYYTVVVTLNGCSDSSIQYAVICTGVNELTAQFNLHLQPNPANDVLNISYELAKSTILQLNIQDVTGRKVQQVFAEEQSAGRYTKTVNVSELSSGVYILNFVSVNGNYNAKFIKE